MLKLSRLTWFKIFGLCLLLPGPLLALSVLLPHRADACVGLACLSFPVCLVLGLFTFNRAMASDA